MLVDGLVTDDQLHQHILKRHIPFLSLWTGVVNDDGERYVARINTSIDGAFQLKIIGALYEELQL